MLAQVRRVLRAVVVQFAHPGLLRAAPLIVEHPLASGGLRPRVPNTGGSLLDISGVLPQIGWVLRADYWAVVRLSVSAHASFFPGGQPHFSCQDILASQVQATRRLQLVSQPHLTFEKCSNSPG